MIAALVLAGGSSRRMGGNPKGFLVLDGRPLNAHVLDAMIAQCEPVLIVSGENDPSDFAGFACPIVTDAVPGRAGPLAGILGGLDWLAVHRPEIGQAVSVAIDTPFLPRDLVARLGRACSDKRAVMAAAASGGRRHPVCALWPLDLRHDLRRALVIDGLRVVGAFLERHDCAWVEWAAAPVDPFTNLNTPDDLARAHAVARGRSPG